MVGEEDHRTPGSEAEQFYDALEIRKIPTALIRVPGASHTASPNARRSWRRKTRRSSRGSGGIGPTRPRAAQATSVFG